MGTRGAVAWLDKKGQWLGVYNHWDSYPTGLGIDVLETVLEKGLDKVAADLQKYGDWREFKAEGVCEYCGKVTGQPHSISGAALMGRMLKPTDASKDAIEARNNIAATGYPDPHAKHHQHNDEDPKKNQFDPRRDPLFMEWVYLLRPDTGTIEIYTHAGVPKGHPGAVELDHSPGVFYGHIKVGEVQISGLKKRGIPKEAKSLEEKGHELAEASYEAAKKDEKARGIKPRF